jgi:hypothetical protein
MIPPVNSASQMVGFKCYNDELWRIAICAWQNAQQKLFISLQPDVHFSH